ncbi:MAG: CHASE2 domain-containing protein [Elusimicrobiota bacterium]
MKRHSLYSLLLLIIFLIAILTGTEFFQPQEMAAYDWLMKTRPARIVSPEIAVIEISDDTLKSLGRWPLPRNYHAALIKALSESGCRMIVFDILLSEASRADDILAKEIRNSGRVYFPYAFRLGAKKDKNGKIPVSGEILAGLSETLKPFSAGAGHINIFVDSDGKTRRLPLWVRYGNKLWPALGFLAAAKRMGYPLKKIESMIPIDSKGAFWVNYPGAWTKTFQHFSYLDVLKAYAARQKGADARLDLRVFKDKICFVGLTAAGTSDLRANPFDSVYPMVGAQASVCDSFLRGDFISRPRFLWRAAVNSCVFIAVFTVCAYFAPLPAFLFSVFLLFLYSITAWFLFALKGGYLDLFLPLLSVALVYTGVLLQKFFEEAQKRRVLEKELEIAASIQRSFLPSDIRNLGSIQLRAFLKPAKFVGGDFYDIICIDDRRPMRSSNPVRYGFLKMPYTASTF